VLDEDRGAAFFEKTKTDKVDSLVIAKLHSLIKNISFLYSRR